MTDAKPEPKSKAARIDGQCLCGCGEVTTPRYDFRQGHDMRVKGMLSRLERGKPEEKFRLPDVLVARATIDPMFKVHGYDAETILRHVLDDYDLDEISRRSGTSTRKCFTCGTWDTGGAGNFWEALRGRTNPRRLSCTGRSRASRM